MARTTWACGTWLKELAFRPSKVPHGIKRDKRGGPLGNHGTQWWIFEPCLTAAMKNSGALEPAVGLQSWVSSFLPHCMFLWMVLGSQTNVNGYYLLLCHGSSYPATTSIPQLWQVSRLTIPLRSNEPNLFLLSRKELYPFRLDVFCGVARIWWLRLGRTNATSGFAMFCIWRHHGIWRQIQLVSLISCLNILNPMNIIL